MSNVVIGVGDLAASKTSGDVLKTYALGSCVAVVLLHPKTRTVGMVHVVLPESNINPAKAKEKPGYFADTGIPALLREMAKLGCQKGSGPMVVKLAGGAQILDDNNTFNIGKRNVLAVKKVLWQFGLGAVGEDVGSTISRTVAVNVNTGETVIISPGRPNRNL
ncbi:MAG: chemotaxis protein CheD [Desulfuromonas sp.]|uniref:chemotaxis protein CheD n=1 Tax=Desulfuromonas sp. TaxID=892 RepID=UPI000CA8A3FA|nr:chemotaxis protein CheD [Desulfuromonas sp.]PLX84982.1 MAG: chemotaxis protein CheD [Desulfuromonas sp.]